MFIADAHADTLYARAIQGHAPELCAVTPDRMNQVGSLLMTFALFTGRNAKDSTAYQDALMMMAQLDNLGVPIIKGRLPDEKPNVPTGILSVEGGEMFEGNIERLYEFHNQARIRMIALTWNYENEIGHPAKNGPTPGLKPFGRELIEEMDKLGIVVDVSHLNEAGFYDAIELSKLPVIASHSNYRPLCEHVRNLTKDQVEQIINKRGFIGINFYSAFLASGRLAKIDDVLRHAEAILALGGEDVLGFGSDFDGIDEWPEWLGEPSQFPRLVDLLLQQNYAEALVEKIAGGNLWRVLKDAERTAL